MNELNKLFGSILLLVGGFAAAALVGPPQVVERITQLLEPKQSFESDALRPLPADGPGTTTDGWPQRPAPSDQPFAVGDESTAFASPAPIALTQASPTAWPEPHQRSDEAEQREARKPEATDVGPPSDDWFTGKDFDFSTDFPAPSASKPGSPDATPPKSSSRSLAEATPARPLTPVARSPREAEAPTSVASTWPELRAPQQTAASQAAGDELPSLERAPYDTPYASRPAQDRWNGALAADVDGAPASKNPLRFDVTSVERAPVERSPVATRYEQHVVTDGDTLASLADYYLGDAARARELYELNSDRLENPDILPIGMVLKTPDDRGQQHASRKPQAASTIDAFPPQPNSGTFSTVATTSGVQAFARDVAQGLQRPMTAIGEADDRPLSEQQRLGPIDPLYDRDVSWDANRW